MSDYFDSIYAIVKRIPKGKVATYGDVAALAGRPRAAREVGWALHVNPDPANIPCHRVVNRFGGLSSAFAFGGKDEHKARLEAEGIEIEDCNVDLEKYRW
ncbi:MAG: MGMT family protein [Oscillospiraceae bacterium]|nr:MGMT family protein [Oscillospiraceae bacterium]